MAKVVLDGHTIEGTPAEIVEVVRRWKQEHIEPTFRSSPIAPAPIAPILLPHPRPRLVSGPVTVQEVEKVPETEWDALLSVAPDVTTQIAGKFFFGERIPAVNKEVYRALFFALQKARRRRNREAHLPRLGARDLLLRNQSPEGNDAGGE